MIGQTISHYKIVETLGVGGMGVVYKAEDTRLKRHVALKFLTKALPTEASERKRFLREAQAASAINHPNVCIMHAVEEERGEEFLVMEFVEGMTLRKWMGEKARELHSGQLPLRDTLALLLQVADGLEAAHRKGIVHRDIKPENIMVTEEGRVKIMDFGIAKLMGETRMTRTGSTLGTVAYMSPEQVQGAEIDQQADVYSFGALLYEMLAGTVPLKGDTVMGLMYAIVHTEPKPLGDVRPGIDPVLAKIVMKCMAKKKSDRYVSLKHVIIDLKATEEQGKTFLASPVKAVGRSGMETPARGGGISAGFRKMLLFGVPALLVLVVAGYVLFTWMGKTSEPRANLVPDSLKRIQGKPDTSQVQSAKGAVASTGSGQVEPAPAAASVASVDDLATSLVQQLQKSAGSVKGKIVVRPFTFQDTQFGSAFSLYFRSLVESRGSTLASWSVHPKDDGAGDALQLTGTYWEQAEQLRFTAQLQEGRTRETVGRAEAAVDQKEVQKLGRPWTPDNFRSALDVIRQLGNPEPESAGLKLELVTNKGSESPIFMAGDLIKVSVKVDRPSIVRVFFHAIDGNVYALTADGDLIILPGESNKLTEILAVECAPPFGAGILQAFATTGTFKPIQLKLTDSGLYALDSRFENALVATRAARRPGSTTPLVERRVVMTTISK